MTTRYTLPKLPYSYDALEPWCPEETLRLHHSKHHAAYVTGANEASDAIATIDPSNSYELAGAQASLTFNLGGHVLHSLFWPTLSPSKTSPSGELATELIANFGSKTRFHDLLTAVSVGVHGSGWGALMYDTVSRTMRIAELRDHQYELVASTELLAVIDVWEHAYYLTNQNDRATWVQAVIDHFDWAMIAERYALASKKPTTSK